MFYNLKIALRNLCRNGLYSIINMTGLAISLAACILIMLWVQDELSYDKFHKRYKDIYLTNYHFSIDSKDQFWSASCPPLATAGKEQIPEMENACRINEIGVDFLKSEKHVFNNPVCVRVDSSFFSMFDFKLVGGNQSQLFPDLHAVVLSKKAAFILFNKENPVGKKIKDPEGVEFQVTAVMEDLPQNSSNRFDVLFSYAFYEFLQPNSSNDWTGTFNAKTYFLLRSGSNAEKVSDQLSKIFQKKAAGSESVHDRFELQTIGTENLYNADGSMNSKMQACRLFTVAGLVLLLIACINYVNLITARASRRYKEISIKKLLGIHKRALFGHFFQESILMFFISLVIATFLIYLIFPAYNQIAGKEMTFHLFSNTTITVYGITFLLTLLFAGIYPAYYLTIKNHPQQVNTGNLGVNSFIRKFLVVLQFTATIILIFGAITINLQMNYIRMKNPGYQKENLFFVQFSEKMNDKQLGNEIKNRLTAVKSIKGTTLVSNRINEIGNQNGSFECEGLGTVKKWINYLYTDADFTSVTGVKIMEGHGFTKTPADSTSFILNQTAVKEFGITDPIGKKFNNMGINGQIIGIAEDFHFENMHEPIKPLSIIVNKQVYGILVRTYPQETQKSLQAVEKIWKEYNPDIPFTYSFLDDEFEKTYKSDIRTQTLFNWFSGIAILISCLGLFGLVAYTAETKTKEIGIRKTLGASVRDIVNLLSKEFLILVGIAMLIAFPLAYYWLNKMLQDYAYRISISWWMFGIAGLITLSLTIFTVAGQALKAATANPVNAIKTE